MDKDIEKLQQKLDMEKKINENNTNAYMKLLHTSQALEQRIDNAIEFIDIYTDGIDLGAFDCLKLMLKIKDILKGSKNE